MFIKNNVLSSPINNKPAESIDPQVDSSAIIDQILED